MGDIVKAVVSFQTIQDIEHINFDGFLKGLIKCVYLKQECSGCNAQNVQVVIVYEV